MPPKKRKAAKKRRKEQASNTIGSSSTNNPRGNDDPKSQDERDSDASSHVSQDDRTQQYTFVLSEDEGKKSKSHVTEVKPVEKATKDAESTEKLGSDGVDFKFEKGLEPKNDLEITHVSIQRVEHDKSSSSSSSSSSGKSCRSSSDDESQAFKMKSKEEASYDTQDKSSTVLSEGPKVSENVTFENGRSYSAGKTVAVDNSVKTALSMPEKMDISAKNTLPDSVESGLKASEENLLPSSNGISGAELEGAEGKNFPSSDIPTAETSDVSGTNQTLDPHEHSEKQPLVASTPPPVQRTSCLGCCGLFEVFTGSGR